MSEALDVDVPMQVGVDVAPKDRQERRTAELELLKFFATSTASGDASNAGATCSAVGFERSSTVGAAVAVGCARTSAPMATGCMGVATCGARESEEYAARPVPKRSVREQRVNWSATLPYQSHLPWQECSDGSATVATWSTWQIRRKAYGRGRVQNQKCSCTRETRADRWSSRAAFDSQAAACNGTASPGNQRAPRSLLGLRRRRRRPRADGRDVHRCSIRLRACRGRPGPCCARGSGRSRRSRHHQTMRAHRRW